jgi:hypothetical protein
MADEEGWDDPVDWNVQIEEDGPEEPEPPGMTEMEVLPENTGRPLAETVPMPPPVPTNVPMTRRRPRRRRVLQTIQIPDWHYLGEPLTNREVIERMAIDRMTPREQMEKRIRMTEPLQKDLQHIDVRLEEVRWWRNMERRIRANMVRFNETERQHRDDLQQCDIMGGEARQDYWYRKHHKVRHRMGHIERLFNTLDCYE